MFFGLKGNNCNEKTCLTIKLCFLFILNFTLPNSSACHGFESLTGQAATAKKSLSTKYFFSFFVS